MAGALKVLVVDDEPEVAELHVRVVESRKGFAVAAVAHSGGAALEAVAAHRPDVMLLDFGLPDIEGREVLRRLRATDPSGVDVIAVTAANDLDSVRYARSAGVHHYLVKPFALSALGDRLERVRAERRVLHSGGDRLEQESVDLILGGGGSPSGVSTLPKGLGSETLGAVRRALADAEEPLSAAQLARAIGVSRVTARRYLEFLQQAGEAVRTPQYGKGRPEYRYAAL